MNGRNRRRKDVPFNPFAPNAVAERNRRQAERAKEKRRQDAQNVAGAGSPAANENTSNKSLEELRKKAQQKLGVEDTKAAAEAVVTEIVVVPVEPEPVKEDVILQPEPVPSPKPDEKIEQEIIPIITQNSEENLAPKTQKPSREERLAELKRKSQQSKDNAKARKTKPQTEITSAKSELTAVNGSILDAVINDNNGETSTSNIDDKNINVFKTIQSVDKKSAGISKKKRKNRRIDKKGGGRQRMEKKLSKHKILEFKYVARDILDNPDVPEEHRSNVLGQIIAKGERISIEAALEFIEQKNLELILTDEISDKLKSEIKSITTRR